MAVVALAACAGREVISINVDHSVITPLESLCCG